MQNVVTRVGMPLAEFIEQTNDQSFELINGARKPRLPSVFGHSEAVHIAFRTLYAYTDSHQLGETYMNATFILPDAYDSDWVTGSRTPDVMFYAGDRVAAFKAQHPDYRARPLAIVPDLVIEVISPTDKYSDMDEKVDAYLLDGVRLIWVFDPQRRKATVHAPDTEQPLHLKHDGVLKGGEVVPGFELPLAKLVE